jgi:hypothetical protein
MPARRELGGVDYETDVRIDPDADNMTTDRFVEHHVDGRFVKFTTRRQHDAVETDKHDTQFTWRESPELRAHVDGLAEDFPRHVPQCQGHGWHERRKSPLAYYV